MKNPARLQKGSNGLLLLLILFLFGLLFLYTLQSINPANPTLLPNGWSLTPVGKQLSLGDLPLNIAVSPDRMYAAVTNNGESTQSIQLISLKQQKVLDTYKVGKSWLGLAFGDSGKDLYASGGYDNWILHFTVKNNKLICTDTLRIAEPLAKVSVAGLTVDDLQHRIYVVTKDNNSLYVLDSQTGKIIKQIPLEAEGYTCILSPDRQELYVSVWGGKKVDVFDTKSLQKTDTIAVGSHPNDMCTDKNGNWLFVANSDDNSVSVIQLKTRKVVETLNAALYPTTLSGSTTNGVALSADDKRLYVANADNNCLAVFDVSAPSKSRSLGFIPTGWYPDAVRVAGNHILVANGKGLKSMANPLGPNPARKNSDVEYQKGGKNIKVQYIAGLFIGTMSIIAEPDEEKLARWTQMVYKNTPYNKKRELLTDGAAGNPVPKKVGEKSPIKYVFYIVKENRTYDQVLGDLPQANGDTSLVLFGRKYTPNQHKIAEEFVLLDNFYNDAEVSEDGHIWSLGAYANDYLEKNWPTYYGSRGGEYDGEGHRPIACNKNGFLWDDCARNGVTYRTYGEFADNFKANIPVLKGHVCPYFTGWDQSVMDTTRFREWKQEFDSLVAINKVPQLNTLRFINDHTEGLKFNRPTPFAAVADNDLAVGLFVEHLSHSPIWNESVVFIVEDDSQNGPDHVDAHRSTAYVAGGFVKKSFVDHTSYSTSSVLRTIELILGLPPMSQYDAAAEPMWRCFDTVPHHPVFTALPAQTDLFARNRTLSYWQRKSETFDFSKEDLINEQDMNEVLWVACRGTAKPCPAPVHAAFVSIKEED